MKLFGIFALLLCCNISLAADPALEALSQEHRATLARLGAEANKALGVEGAKVTLVRIVSQGIHYKYVVACVEVPGREKVMVPILFEIGEKPLPNSVVESGLTKKVKAPLAPIRTENLNLETSKRRFAAVLSTVNTLLTEIAEQRSVEFNKDAVERSLKLDRYLTEVKAAYRGELAALREKRLEIDRRERLVGTLSKNEILFREYLDKQLSDVKAMETTTMDVEQRLRIACTELSTRGISSELKKMQVVLNNVDIRKPSLVRIDLHGLDHPYKLNTEAPRIIPLTERVAVFVEFLPKELEALQARKLALEARGTSMSSADLLEVKVIERSLTELKVVQEKLVEVERLTNEAALRFKK